MSRLARWSGGSNFLISNGGAASLVDSSGDRCLYDKYLCDECEHLYDEYDKFYVLEKKVIP